MLNYMSESKSVFKLDELEKKLKKACGITSQSVKEILLSLVDDNLVDHDKIGIGNYYWALPSKLVAKKQNMLEKKQQEIINLKDSIEHNKKRKIELISTRKQDDQRTIKLKKLKDLKATRRTRTKTTNIC